MNPRYQKNTGPAGKTRKSASSAKPKREAASGDAPAKKPSARPRLRDAFAAPPSTPEMRKWRRIWWILIGVALVLALAAAVSPRLVGSEALAWPLMAIYTLVLGAALYIDLRIIRPLRQQAAGGKTEKSGKKG